MTTDPGGMETRKRRDIDVCLTKDVEHNALTTGLEHYRLPYNALTQTSLGAIDLTTDFLGKRLKAPVLVGAMTGGAELSRAINRNLATAAAQLGGLTGGELSGGPALPHRGAGPAQIHGQLSPLGLYPPQDHREAVIPERVFCDEVSTAQLGERGSRSPLVHAGGAAARR